MSKKATEFQRKAMSRMYRGKEIFKPLNTGWIDENVACVREWVANIFFYRKGDTTIMVDAGYNYDRLAEKMGWLGIDPKSIHHILITHQDTDHVGAVEADSPGLFRNAKLYIGEIENRYLTGEVRRKVIYHLYKLPQVTIYYEFTTCPAAEFAKRFGFADIMPALCNVDYASMELLHAKLVRTTTCVDGCRCDYTICGDKDPYVKEHPEYRDENGYRRNK